MPAPEPRAEAAEGSGLSRREEECAAGEFFSLIPWDAPIADPEMPAGDFLDAVGSHD